MQTCFCPPFYYDVTILKMDGGTTRLIQRLAKWLSRLSFEADPRGTYLLSSNCLVRQSKFKGESWSNDNRDNNVLVQYATQKNFRPSFSVAGICGRPEGKSQLFHTIPCGCKQSIAYTVAIASKVWGCNCSVGLQWDIHSWPYMWTSVFDSSNWATVPSQSIRKC